MTRCNCLKIIRIAQRRQVTCVPGEGLAGEQKTLGTLRDLQR